MGVENGENGSYRGGGVLGGHEAVRVRSNTRQFGREKNVKKRN